MNLHQLILTNNDCYKAGKAIVPKGIMVHSTGANNPNLKRYVGPDDGLLGINQYGNHWNTATPGGRQVCVHAFIGKLKDGTIATYQTLPWNMRGWHGGGSSNNTHIGFEICEDGLTDASYFSAVYKEAVELCVYLCKQYGLTEKNIICHCEGYKQGIANRLNEMGIPTRMNKSWCQATISKMLRNEKYAGDLLLQKTFRTDHLSKQTRINHGELPQYLVQEAHEPIIDRATFDTVQAEIERRANKTTVKKGTATVFTGKIRCGVCGKNYRRKTTKTGFVWICATFNTKGKKFCASKQVPEETLKAVCAEALGTGSFDDDTFAAHIDFITALPDNVLEFHFKDGQTTAVGWQDRSRRESWTDDKRQAARGKATRRND